MTAPDHRRQEGDDRDPVCGMTVPEDGPHQFQHGSDRYHFCSAHCLERFRSNPEAFTTPDAKAPSAPRQSGPPGRHVCPMHPAVVSNGPGDCPECGMALEPDLPAMGVTAWTCPMHAEISEEAPGDCPICGMPLEPRSMPTEEANPELADMQRRFAISALLALPVLVLAMGDMVGLPLDRWLAHHTQAWLELIFATPAVLWGGWPFFVRGWRSLIARRLNMFTLIALGTGVAYAYSLVALVAPGLFPESFRTNGQVAIYFEAAAVIVTLVLLGQVLELRARNQTSQAIRALLGLAPTTARRIDSDGIESDVPLSSVAAGDRLRVRPGEKVPTDGEVLEGDSDVDESMISGEPMAVRKSMGDTLIGATINGTGSLVMRADRIGSETVLARIVQMVADAQRSRAPIQRQVDLVAGWFVPVVLAAALITFAAWGLYGPSPRMAHALINAVAVLIIACPCALGLATPMSIMVATGRAASAGVLFRDAEAIEVLGQVDTLIVDKTGTLTEGKPRLITIEAAGLDADDLLRLAASLERGSEHPLASAIIAGATERGLELGATDQFQSITGQGVTGTVGGRHVGIGNGRLLAGLGAFLDEEAMQRVEGLRREGQTVMLVAVDGVFAGLLGVSDPIKASSAEAIRGLRSEGIRIVMLTGDSRGTAEAVAAQLEIDDLEAEVAPEGKEARVRQLQEDGHVVAMAGDGINDAPALARAQVGIAMGTGTDVAMESAGVTLVKGDLRGILRARRVSRATMANIRQNLVFAFGYNALGIPIAAGLLYPMFGILLSPMIAAAAMSLSSVSVIANALRLRRASL